MCDYLTIRYCNLQLKKEKNIRKICKIWLNFLCSVKIDVFRFFYGFLNLTVMGRFECFRQVIVWACEICFSPLIPTTTHPIVSPRRCDSLPGVTLVTTDREENPWGSSSNRAPNSVWNNVKTRKWRILVSTRQADKEKKW